MKVIRVIMKACMAHVKCILRNYNLLAAYIIDQHCVFDLDTCKIEWMSDRMDHQTCMVKQN